MIRSMTGFAARRGSRDGMSWSWEMRGVNAKGLDIRLRMPDWIDGLEQTVRSDLGKALGRGAITVALRVVQDDSGADLTLDEAQLDRVLGAFARIEDRALASGLTLAQPTAADVMTAKGVLTGGEGPEGDTAALLTELRADLQGLVEDFVAMRQSEGNRLRDILESQLTLIESLTEDARAAAEARQGETRAALKAALQRVVEDTEVPEERVAQELAILAVKQDVTEELDRLTAHVAAARALLDQTGPVGRKLDFLAQEFNREANTLCSKAQNAALTAIGLDLKAAVDQMREQALNVE